MKLLRAFILRNRAAAGVLVAAALLLKVLVPAGFMIGGGAHAVTIEICHDGEGGTALSQISIPLKGDKQDEPGKPLKGECPFATLSMASLSGADVALLALAFAFIVLLGFAPARSPWQGREQYVRPPLRGPPVPSLTN